MYTYKYKAISNNVKINGYISAKNLNEAVVLIKNISSKIIYINKCYVSYFGLWRYRSQKTVNQWFANLSILMKQGIKIEDALKILSKDKNYFFSSTILELIRSGFDFSSAIEKHSFFFDKNSINIMKSLGRFMAIENICDFIYMYNSKIYEKSSSVKKILIPPLLTFIITFCICSGLIIIIKGPIESIMNDMNVQAPLLFQILDKFTLNKFILCITLVCGLVWCIKKYVYHIPVLRKYYISQDIFIAFYSIAKALENGVQIIDSINISHSSLKTPYVKGIISKLRSDLLRGESAHKSLRTSGLDESYISIIRVHEIAGDISKGFLCATNLANELTSRYFSILENSLGPLITITTTFFIVLFLNSVILPIYSCVSGFLS